MKTSVDCFLNIKLGVLISGSEALVQVAHRSRVIRLYGEVQFVADYKSLTLSATRELDVVKVLETFCSLEDPVRSVHQLTQLVGDFVLVIEEGGVVTYLYKSGGIEAPVYYGHGPSGLIVHTSWQEVLKRLGQIELSQADLEDFLRYGSCQESRTLFKGLWIMKPYALYRCKATGIALITHSFPGLHTVDPDRPPQYEIHDYLRAVSAYKDLSALFSLAYSGGTDSQMLAGLYAEKVNELITFDYKGPYSNLKRTKERMAGEKAAMRMRKHFTGVTVDFSRTDELDAYFRDYVFSNPFSAYLAVHYYLLASHSESQVILNGQNADGIWGLGLHQITFSKSGSGSTSSSCILDDLLMLYNSRDNFKRKIKTLLGKYVSRFAIIHSFEKVRFEKLINLRRQYGPEFDCLRNWPYKMFHLREYVNYCMSGDCTAWISAAKYFSKKAILPYSSPLVLHIASHIKRRDYFDLKAPLRRLYSEFDPDLITLDDKDNCHQHNWWQSPLFDQLQNSSSGRKLLCLRSKLNIDKSNHPNHPYPLPELHLYHLFKIVSEQLGRTHLLETV